MMSSAQIIDLLMIVVAAVTPLLIAAVGEIVADADAEQAIEQLRAERLQPRLHDLLRLHGPDPQGRQEVPRREI